MVDSGALAETVERKGKRIIKKKQGEQGDGAGGPKTRELASTPDNRK
jgi:hypothetical protein